MNAIASTTYARVAPEHEALLASARRTRLECLFEGPFRGSETS